MTRNIIGRWMKYYNYMTYSSRKIIPIFLNNFSWTICKRFQIFCSEIYTEENNNDTQQTRWKEYGPIRSNWQVEYIIAAVQKGVRLFSERWEIITMSAIRNYNSSNIFTTQVNFMVKEDFYLLIPVIQMSTATTRMINIRVIPFTIWNYTTQWQNV